MEKAKGTVAKLRDGLATPSDVLRYAATHLEDAIREFSGLFEFPLGRATLLAMMCDDRPLTENDLVSREVMRADHYYREARAILRSRMTPSQFTATRHDRQTQEFVRKALLLAAEMAAREERLGLYRGKTDLMGKGGTH